MVLNCRVTIGNFVFTSIGDIEIKKTWKKFTDTAKIKIPRALYFFEDEKLVRLEKPIQEVVKPNDRVKIELGYNRELITEFEGYVAYSPKATIPYEIECEDEMYQLKQKQVSINIEDAMLRQILEKAAPGYEIDCPDELYGDFSMNKVTPLEVFNELRKRSGIYTFFRKGRLVSGLIYSDQRISKIIPNYKIGQNIIDNSLEYVRPGDVRFKIFASSIQKNGSVLREEIGELGGNIVRKDYGSSISRKQLKDILKREFERVKDSGGYSGEITSFGFPFVEHGQTIRVFDDVYEKRDTNHFIDEVRVKFSSQSGYRRFLKPSKQNNERNT